MKETIVLMFRAIIIVILAGIGLSITNGNPEAQNFIQGLVNTSWIVFGLVGVLGFITLLKNLQNMGGGSQF